MSELVDGLKTAFASSQYRIAGVAVFCVALPAYMMTLAASYTGGVIGPAALKYLDTEMVDKNILMCSKPDFHGGTDW